ncbi:MAG: hypothetical protein IIA33_09600 [Planctomycetes bacterium]|nr:hypothetical protein [Planctomycetota bacterium]
MIATETSRLDAIIENMREPVREFADLVQQLSGSNAESLTVFGALAGGSFDPKQHTVRSVLVLDNIDLDLLRRLAEEGERLGKSGFAAPLIMTPDYIAASLDTFPLELIEIHQCHVNVFGTDHFKDLKFEDGHVRLQCEREFKSILISLRQGLLAAAGRDDMLEAVEVDIAEKLVRTMRGMLWLKGRKEAKHAAEVVDEVGELVKHPLAGVRAALDPNVRHGWEEFQQLYQDVAAVGDIVDAW